MAQSQNYGNHRQFFPLFHFFVTPVLLFVNETPQVIGHACMHVPGAWLQFHGDESPEFCVQAARRAGRRWIRAGWPARGSMSCTVSRRMNRTRCLTAPM